MGTLESQEVVEALGKVVECAIARGRAQAVEELAESQMMIVPLAEVPGYDADTYAKLIAAMEKIKLFELPWIVQLERDQELPIKVIMEGLVLGRHILEDAETQPDYFLKPDELQLQVPVFAQPRDILNPFALEREVPLKECLEAHYEMAAKKRGVKGKATLCGVGVAHIPRSDGVPVSMATVSPKDCLLLRKLQEAGNSSNLESSPKQERCRSI